MRNSKLKNKLWMESLMNINRRGFLGGLLAVATATVAPVVWISNKIRLSFINTALEAIESKGTIYFPPGIYKGIFSLTQEGLTFDLNNRVVGCDSEGKVSL
jgi:hypothetical protein